MDRSKILSVAGIILLTLAVFAGLSYAFPAASGSPLSDIVEFFRNINRKLDQLITQLTTWFGPAGEYHNVTKMESHGDLVVVDTEYERIVHVNRSQPFKLSITIAADHLDLGDEFVVWYAIGIPGGAGWADALSITETKTYALEVVCNEFELYARTIAPLDGVIVVYYSYAITYSEG